MATRGRANRGNCVSVHTVTVTKLDNMHIEGLADEDYVDEVEYIIDHCPGGTCTVWWGCENDGCRDRVDEDDEFFAHGEDHQRIDGVWMIQSKQCAARATDSGRDGMQEEAQAAGLGTHQLEVDYWGDGQWAVGLIRQTGQA